MAGLHACPFAASVAAQDWLHRHFVHALGQTWDAWCAIASGMQESGCYVVSPLLFPTRILWTDYTGDRDAQGIASPHTYPAASGEVPDDA